MPSAPADEPRANVPEWSVSELSAALKRTVEDEFGHVRVRGEISGYRGPHSSGHSYFALKDESARIDAVIWKGVAGRMRFKPEEGMEVIATGRLTTYPGRSNYQIVIESLEPAGVGALMALLEERKKKLAAEGLFDEARKQLIPYLPEVIGVVTSPTGAVIRDILHRLADRFPRNVLVWPVRVQGDGAAEEVAAAIRGFNAMAEDGKLRRPDLIIVARGGGSIEDLWSFNEEIVLRAAADSMIPLISAVGHETDVTLIDFASDVRAPTPTAAAEMAVPVRSDLLAEVSALGHRQTGAWLRGIEARRTELRAAARALQRPEQLLEARRQTLDNLAERLPQSLRANSGLHQLRFSRVAARLTPQALSLRLKAEQERVARAERGAQQSLRVNVERRRERFNAVSARLASGLRTNAQSRLIAIARQRERTNTLYARIETLFAAQIERRVSRVDRASGLLSALSYHGVLARGFALVRDASGTPLRAASSINAGLALDIEFADGRIAATATSGSGSPPPAASPASQAAPVKPKTKPGGTDQGNLF
jgi:exodeoxyribonuclease VII large subunit